MDKECIHTRKKIIERTKAEMLGPGSEDIGGDIRHEVISDSPVERYSLGILFPQNIKYGQDDNEKQKVVDSNEEDYDDEEEIKNYKKSKEVGKNHSESFNDDETIDEEISMANQSMPSAMGLTCFVKGKTVVKEFHFHGTRTMIREQSVAHALDLIRRCLIENYD